MELMDWIDGSVSLEEMNRIIDSMVKNVHKKRDEEKKTKIALHDMNEVVCDQEAFDDFFKTWEESSKSQPGTSASTQIATSPQLSNSSYKEAFEKFINEWDADKHSQPAPLFPEPSEKSVTTTQCSTISFEKIMVPEGMDDSIMIYDEETDDWILRPLNKTQYSPLREEVDDWIEPDPLGNEIDLEIAINIENSLIELSQQH